MSYKKIAALVGYEIDKDEDFNESEFVTEFNKKFIDRSSAVKDESIRAAVTGKLFGELNTKAAQKFGLASSEVKEKKMEEIFDLVASKYNTEIAAAKELGGKGDEEKVKTYEATIAGLKKQYEDAAKSWETEKGQFGSQINELHGTVKNVKLGVKRNQAFGSISFIDEFHKDTLKKEGFNAIISNKYDLDLDENENLVVKNKADGTPVMSKKSAGIASFDEVLANEADANGLLKKNNTEVVTKRVITVGGESKSVDNKRVHPKARQHADKLGA